MGNLSTEDSLYHRIWYRYWLEVMTETINRRVDTMTNATNLVLGAVIFAASDLSWLFGGIIAIFSGSRIAWQFGKKAEAARQQNKRYRTLINEMHSLSIDEMQARISTLKEFDSPALSCLFNPARNRATISLGLDKKHMEKLSITERAVSGLAGGVPN